jgi:hypothetical protein
MNCARTAPIAKVELKGYESQESIAYMEEDPGLLLYATTSPSNTVKLGISACPAIPGRTIPCPTIPNGMTDHLIILRMARLFPLVGMSTNTNHTPVPSFLTHVP